MPSPARLGSVETFGAECCRFEFCREYALAQPVFWVGEEGNVLVSSRRRGQCSRTLSPGCVLRICKVIPLSVARSVGALRTRVCQLSSQRARVDSVQVLRSHLGGLSVVDEGPPAKPADLGIAIEPAGVDLACRETSPVRGLLAVWPTSNLSRLGTVRVHLVVVSYLEIRLPGRPVDLPADLPDGTVVGGQARLIQNAIRNRWYPVQNRVEY